MPTKLKEICDEDDKIAPGHRGCAGCTETIIVRQVLHAIKDPVVVACPTGCLEVITSPYPQTSWRVPWIHSAFENVATTLSGVEAAYKVLVKRGKIKDRNIKFVAFAGDGATYDIGFQWLSGALERGHQMIYICLNNEAYMNTGIQRSSATPLGAWTTTTPIGEVIPGKLQHRKELTHIIAAHNIPYVAQAAPHAWQDLMSKVQKATAIARPSFINILAPCPRGWRYNPEEAMTLSRLAVETCIWPLYEVENGVWRLTSPPLGEKSIIDWLKPDRKNWVFDFLRQKKPVVEWFKSQGRFSHLFRPENKWVIEEVQKWVDREWKKLLRRCKMFNGEQNVQ